MSAKVLVMIVFFIYVALLKTTAVLQLNLHLLYASFVIVRCS